MGKKKFSYILQNKWISENLSIYEDFLLIKRLQVETLLYAFFKETTKYLKHYLFE